MDRIANGTRIYPRGRRQNVQKAFMDWILEITKLCNDRGLSNAKLAVELGFSKQYLSHVLTEAKQPSPELKFQVWSRLNHRLTPENLLGFLPSDVATKLRHLDKMRVVNLGTPRPKTPLTNDWICDLVQIRDRQGLNSRAFAEQLGLSQPYLSVLLAGKKPIPWDLKVHAWEQMNFDLSCETLLNFLPAELAGQLVEIEGQRAGNRS